jgi:hypothetical protein
MSRTRLSDDKPSHRLISLAHRNGRLEGESDGRTWGKFEERTRIVKWLKDRPERTAHQLAILIENGTHSEE